MTSRLSHATLPALPPGIEAPLFERDRAQARARIMGALVRVIHADNGTLEVLEAIDRPEVGIVSLTVTQAGYCIDNGTKRLDVEHPEIAHDLAHPAQPRSAVGVLTAALARRRAAGRPRPCQSPWRPGSAAARDGTIRDATCRSRTPPPPFSTVMRPGPAAMRTRCSRTARPLVS